MPQTPHDTPHDRSHNAELAEVMRIAMGSIDLYERASEAGKAQVRKRWRTSSRLSATAAALCLAASAGWPSTLQATLCGLALAAVLLSMLLHHLGQRREQGLSEAELERQRESFSRSELERWDASTRASAISLAAGKASAGRVGASGSNGTGGLLTLCAWLAGWTLPAKAAEISAAKLQLAEAGMHPASWSQLAAEHPQAAALLAAQAIAMLAAASLLQSALEWPQQAQREAAGEAMQRLMALDHAERRRFIEEVEADLGRLARGEETKVIERSSSDAGTSTKGGRTLN